MSRFVSIVLAVCLLLSLQFPVCASQEFGEQQRDVLLHGDDSEVLYRIDDTLTITQADCTARKQSLQHSIDQNRKIADEDKDMLPEVWQFIYDNTQMPSDQEIMDELIEELLLLAEAKSLGITVTEQEAAKYLDEQSAELQNVLDNGTAEERADAQKVADEVQAFIRGLGLSEAEYREQMQIPTFAKILTRAAVRQRFFETVDKDDNMTEDERDASFSKYVDELKEKYPNQLNAVATTFAFGFISVDLPFAPIVSNEVNCIDAEGIGMTLYQASYSDEQNDYSFYYADIVSDMSREEVSEFLQLHPPFTTVQESFERGIGRDLRAELSEDDMAVVNIGMVGEKAALFCVCWHDKSVVAIFAIFNDSASLDKAVENMDRIQYHVQD